MRNYTKCGQCGKKRGRYSVDRYQYDIRRAKCKSCGAVFYIRHGKTYLIPDQVGDLKQEISRYVEKQGKDQD